MRIEYSIDETIIGYYNYHLKKSGTYISLCGKKLLGKELDLKLWGLKTHLNETYCKKCQKMYNNYDSIKKLITKKPKENLIK